MAGANTDQLEAFFRRADLDGDGRISGAEAVAFFQGANLPKSVLAQIWMHADQNKTGFLGRPEFYNALRLVTVAQSKRELTPDMVKAALYGPAAAKIPAPQINLAATSAPQSHPVAAASAPQMGLGTPPTSQNFGFRGPGVPNATMNQNYFPHQQNQSFRPPQALPTGMPTGMHSRPPQAVGGGMGAPNVLSSNISNDWLSRSTGAPPAGPRGNSPSMPSSTSKPQPPVSTSSLLTVNDSKALVVSGNGFASSSAFAGDVFSAAPAQQKQESSGSTYSASSAPTSAALVPVSSGSQSSSKLNALDSLSTFTMQPSSGQFQRPQAPLNPSQQVSAPGSSSFPPPGVSAGVGNSTSESSQPPWPKMKPSDVQKYMKVFMEVDTDRDGRITGEQARNLFLSWRLPREVLKQVWDLSDQDNDSMLSLREFCFSLYLMERYREGRPLPAALPSNIMYDETLLSMTGQPKVTYGNAAWSPNPGFGQQQGMQGSQVMAPATGMRPPMQVSAPQADGALQFNQQHSRALGTEGLVVNQLDNGKPDSANSKLQEPKDAGNKVEETENVILDSREKIEFYRNKMQELVLYKSRCDNRLNEITERALADKREAESLTKKYEEKYKQVAEIASKLTIEEATFREVQERKMELHQAIVKMEQGGSVDGILQVRADRIQYDLEELMKALTERCKKHGFDMKSTAIIELPIGWQPGIQEEAAVWDEDWDKFEDEGFGNDLTIDASAKPQSASVQREKASPDRSSTPDSSSIADEKSGNSFSTGERAHESESAFTHGEDEYARSPNGSPAGRAALESPSREFSDIHYGKSSDADAETHGSFDESTWGAFDNNDDTDSVWGFNPVKTKGSGSEHRDFFGSDDFGVSSVRTGSPNAENTFQKKSLFFEDSVPSTPLSRFGNSPRYSEAGDHYFDNFSRFDAFSSRNDSGFSSQPERFTRFDSINSTKDFGHTRFDSISSSKDFGNSQLTRFDSINSTKDFGNSAYSFDDTDPFGSSGPFKVSSESHTPKKGSDNWSAF